MSGPKIGVIGVKGRWSSELLADTIEKRTGSRYLIDVEDTYFDMETEKMYYNGLDLTSLDALIIKKIAPYYASNLIDKLHILAFINKRGLPIFSKPNRILKLINRLSCTTALKLANIPMLPTFITENVEHANDIVMKNGKCVFKPLFTSKARGMTILEPGEDLLENIVRFKTAGNPVMYIQKFIEIPEKDLGIVFLGGEYIGTYARKKTNSSWNTTTNSGGVYEKYNPPEEIIRIAQKAQDLFDLEFTCVDLVETDKGPFVFEVSAFGGFSGLREALNINAAEIYVDHVLKVLKNDC